MKKKPEKINRFEKPDYKPPKLVLRAGSMDFMKHPTRISKSLFYTDGTRGTDKESTKNHDGVKTK